MSGTRGHGLASRRRRVTRRSVPWPPTFTGCSWQIPHLTEHLGLPGLESRLSCAVSMVNLASACSGLHVASWGSPRALYMYSSRHPPACLACSRVPARPYNPAPGIRGGRRPALKRDGEEDRRGLRGHLSTSAREKEPSSPPPPPGFFPRSRTSTRFQRERALEALRTAVVKPATGSNAGSPAHQDAMGRNKSQLLDSTALTFPGLCRAVFLFLTSREGEATIVETPRACA